VLDVYGLVSAEKIAALAAALAAGDHRKIVALVDEAMRAAATSAACWWICRRMCAAALLDAIAKGGHSDALGTPLTTEQLTRLLDGLREGENGVKLGLSEKINFEVALLKAVEASRARAIDSLIKEIATLADSLPADGSKKND
jgi:DNA polymerase-3 subunit gamma/tau